MANKNILWAVVEADLREAENREEPHILYRELEHASAALNGANEIAAKEGVFPPYILVAFQLFEDKFGVTEKAVDSEFKAAEERTA